MSAISLREKSWMMTCIRGHNGQYAVITDYGVVKISDDTMKSIGGKLIINDEDHRQFLMDVLTISEEEWNAGNEFTEV